MKPIIQNSPNRRETIELLWELWDQKRKTRHARVMHVSGLSPFITDDTPEAILKKIWKMSDEEEMFMYWTAVNLRRCPKWLADAMREHMVSMSLDPDSYSVDEPSRLDYVRQFKQFISEAEIY